MFDYILTSPAETIIALTFKENPKATLTSHPYTFQISDFLCDFEGNTISSEMFLSLVFAVHYCNYYNLCLLDSGGVVVCIAIFFILSCDWQCRHFKVV